MSHLATMTPRSVSNMALWGQARMQFLVWQPRQSMDWRMTAPSLSFFRAPRGQALAHLGFSQCRQ